MPAYYNVITGSRIADSSWSDQSGSDDTAVTGWTSGDDFILAVHMDDNSKDTEAGTYKLQWKKGVGGTFNDLAATGELNYTVGGATSLTDGSPLTSGEGICSNKQGAGWTWVDGVEREDSNATVPFDGSDEDETEFAWAIACDGATAGETYYFQTVDTANGDRIDAIGVTITMAAGVHELTANDLSTGNPDLGTPTIGQTHALDANDLATQNPDLGTPTIGQTHVLTANDLDSQNPDLGSPTIGQEHALTANDLDAQNPDLGSPDLGITHPLDANDLSAGSPDLGTPAIGQIHVLTANDLDSQNPDLGSPTIGQIHVLTANDLSTGAVSLGTPTLAEESGVDNLEAEDLSTGNPDLGTPTIGQVHVLVASDLIAGAVSLGTPVLNGGEEAVTRKHGYAKAKKMPPRRYVIDEEKEIFEIIKQIVTSGILD